jgi:hypothetical protein
VQARLEKLAGSRLTLEGVPPKSRIFVDGHETTDTTIDIDPGKHTLRVDDSKSKPFTWEGSFADGEKKSVTVKMLPADVPKGTTPEKSSGGVLSSPWFWGAVGVVVIGGAAGAYFYDRSKQLGPDSGVTVKL